MMTEETRNELVEVLEGSSNKEVLATIEFLERFCEGGVNTVINFRSGLCFNLMMYSGISEVILITCIDWPRFSGNPKYPIKSNDDSLPTTFYSMGCSYDNLYKGYNLEMRLSLAKHTLESIDQVLQDTPELLEEDLA